MDLNERKLKILQAIIHDFVTTAEPVGSRTLSKKYDLGVSPATIRNEMSDLEEMGYLTHPHTSAGRVPSQQAYRLYVNDLMNKYELPEEEKARIAEELYSNVRELDKTVEYAAKLLSNITNLTSFAMTPKQDQDVLRFINLLPVDERTIVLMIVSESGKVSNMALKLKNGYDEDSLALMSKNMTYTFKGKTISEALTLDIIDTVHSDVAAMNELRQSVMPSFMKTLEDMLNVNLYMDGLTNIFNIPEYNDIDRAKMFMELINKKEDFTKHLIQRDDGLLITIGTENDDESMADCSMITATYHVDGRLVGKLGVIGPTRMKYSEISSVIEFLTDNLSNAYQITGGDDDDD
ncbi:MAG: heat-inducible transcription repressor HrcA [Firmicutes bacterium]|nr:heat-inducible transcription repressor HrcA [Bacillota bacterium]